LYRIHDYQTFTLGYQPPDVVNNGDILTDLFASTLPWTIALHPKQTFAKALHFVQETLNQLQQKQSYLTDVCYRYPSLQEKVGMHPWPCVVRFATDETVPVLAEDHPFILTLYSQQTRYQLTIRWPQSQVVEGKALLARMHGHIEQLCQAVLVNPQQTLAYLDVLTPTEKAQLLDWGQGSEPKDAPYLKQTIAQLFAEQVAQTPEATALLYQGEHISYAALNHFANQLAHDLQTQGLTPQTAVGIYLHRCPQAIVAMLAIVKLGAYYVPIDPDYPVQRVKFMLADAEIKIVLTRTELQEKIKAIALPLETIAWVVVDKHMMVADTAIADIIYPGNAEDIAYLIYTSGTTGQPKGVLVPHRGISRLVKGRECR